MNSLPSGILLQQRRHNRRGATLNIMVVGARGTGKSTFINSLVGRQVADMIEWLDQDAADAIKEPALKFRTYVEDLNNEVMGPTTLQITEVQGYGDCIDNTKSLNGVLNYIESEFDVVLAEESRIKRNPRFKDNRIHALIYFIEPTGHGLREADVEFFRIVGKRANIIPVLSKADTLTQGETLLNRRLVREDFDKYDIQVYCFSNIDGFDNDSAPERSSVDESIPFAMVCTNRYVKLENGRTVTARQYEWGTLLTDDATVSDFSLLRDVLLYSHFDDLKNTTCDSLYESYRTQRLSRVDGLYTNHNAAKVAAGSLAGPTPNGQASAAFPEQAQAQTAVDFLNREEQLRHREEKLRRLDQNLQGELEQRRRQLQRQEAELKELEAKLRKQAQKYNSPALGQLSSF